MLRILGTIFAALLGLAFGSFLNVCLSRWPEGESIVHPRSHCRACSRTLAWWENIPLASWIALRGRCRTCGAWISVRYPLVEAAIAALWAYTAWRALDFRQGDYDYYYVSAFSRYPEGPFLVSGIALFFWLLVGLAVLDAEHLWIPDKLSLPAIALGVIYTVLKNRFIYRATYDFGPPTPPLAPGLLRCIIGVVIAAAIILVIRLLYWLIRRREGLGLGDAKLMAMIAAWLGLPLALLSLFLGVVLGAAFAIGILLTRSRHPDADWAAAKLPLGTFLCIGAIVSALWGEQMLNLYLHWAGF